MSLEPGQIVTIHSLQSEGGKQLNGKKGILVTRVKDDQGDLRWQVKVRGVKPVNATTAIKPANLTLQEESRPLPIEKEGERPRGFIEDAMETSDKCEILTELLVMHTENYDPPKTKLIGLPAMAFSELGQYHFKLFTAMQVRTVIVVICFCFDSS